MISMFVTPCNRNFGEEVLGYLQEGLTNTESENKCATGSDNTGCAVEEQQNHESTASFY
jgi:hypothetical protein